MRRRREPPLTFVIRLAVLSLFPATTAVAASPVEILISEVRKEDQEGSILIAVSILNSNDHLEAVVLPNRIEAQVVQSGATSTVWLERYANMPGEVAIPSAGFYRAIYIMRSASGLDISGAAISIPSWSTRQVVVEPGIMAQPVPTQGEAIAQGSPPAFEENAIVRSKADRTSNNAFLTNLSAYEPVYAVYGPGTQTEARIQFSFNPAYSSGSVRRVGGSGLSDCFDVGKWVSRPFLQRGNLCHGPHPPGAMIARRDFRFQRSGARRSQPRSTEVGSPRMAVFCCWHRPSARWGFAGGLRLALPIRAILRG